MLVTMRVAVSMMMIVVVMMIVIMAAAAGVAMLMRVIAVVVAVMIMPVMIMTMMVMPVMIMPVMIMSMVVMPMMIVTLRRHMLRIGAAFGIERRLDLADVGAQPTQHVLDHMVPADPQLRAENLRRQMAVAEVPGDAGELLEVAGLHFGERLRRGQDLHQPAVLQRQRVALPEHDGFRQVEQEVEAPYAFHGDAAAMAVVIVENDRVGGLAPPRACSLHRYCAHCHDVTPERPDLRATRPCRRR